MRARIIAYYLPQFHPVEVNDKYWGKGFTEWTNVAKAKPLFKNHYQPQIPADLGFYDLRIPDVREQQAKMAKECGVEGFCYWHYWFGNGKKVLDMPFNEVLKSGKPDFPFCIGWANHDWTTKTWEKGKSFSSETMIFEQLYPGDEDHKNHFFELLPAFKDKRYIKVEGKPLFIIVQPNSIPNTKHFIELWNRLAKENGFKGIYFVGQYESLPSMNLKKYRDIDKLIKPRFKELFDKGYDGINSFPLKYAEFKARGFLSKAFHSLARKKLNGIILDKYKYEDIMKNFVSPEDYENGVYPSLIPRRDRSPRSGRKAVIYYGSTPEKFKIATENAIKCVEKRDFDHRLIFLNAWNEWGEGAYMEPDLRFGHAYMDALKECLTKDC